MNLHHHGLCSTIQLYLLLTIPRWAFGQETTSSKSLHTPTTTHQPSLLFPSSMLPSHSDSAPSGDHNNGMNTSGLVNYYFVFLALIIAVVGGAVFFFVRRRHRAMLRRRYSQQEALTRDLGGPRPGGGWANWNPERTRGRYWQGRWRSADESREEGLNEQGEAPPPYVPKRQSQEARREETEPAVPLQTLSRDVAGLKPPDYSEAYSRDLGTETRVSSASAGSSREAERRTSP